jgi:hypothetical protein
VPVLVILAPIELGNNHQTIFINDSFVCKHDGWSRGFNEYYWFNVYFKSGLEVHYHLISFCLSILGY